MTNKKEPLSIIAVKTLLAVIIFTGVGTIIIGGGWLIGNYGKVSEPVKLPQEQPVKIIKEEIKDETADWKTYQNEEYGFKIKHPLICNITENKKSRIISFGGDEDSYLHKDPCICPPMYIVIRDNPNELSAQEWLQKKHPNSYLNKEFDYVFIEGEIKGIETKVKSEKDIYGFVAWLNNDEYIYEIEWSEATDNTSFKSFVKILSTFKFIEK